MAKKRKIRTKVPGLGVDAYGGNVVDPTENVKSLTEAANIRQDDLRAITKELFDAKLAHLKEIADIRQRHSERIVKMRERHQAELRVAEAQRLDSIRQVDREDVSKTQTQSQTAIATLATTQNTTAETLRTQVSTTAQAQLNTITSQFAEVNKRVSALELQSSEGRGKATVESPILIELVAEMKAMRREQSTTVGQKQGGTSAREMIAWALAALVALFFLYNQFKSH